MDHRTCGACGQEMPVAARFCSQCGARLDRILDGLGDQSRTAAADYGERRQLTVMFCDLVESTALSERLDPEDLLGVVRRYQSVVAEVVARYSGHVAQYLGDGLLVYFGYPRAHEDDGRRAVLSGLEIVQAVARLNARLEDERGVAIAVRIGLHTGEVVAAEIGDGAQLALGSTPNIAARVQGMAQPGEVMLTESSHALVHRFVECSCLGPRMLRGLREPVVLYRALEPSRADAARQPASAERTPFVGRDPDLDTLVARFEEARTGQGRVVLVVAEAGLGKSRLLQEAQRRIDGAVSTWLSCWCSAYEQNTSLFGIVDLVERTLEIPRGGDAGARLRTLEERLDALGVSSDDAVPLLGALLSLPVPAERAAELGPAGHRRTLEVIVELVLNLARGGVVVFTVEDLHWADPSTLDLVELLVERVAHEPVLVVLTGRPEFSAAWPAPPYQTLMELERLTERDAVRLVSEWNVGRGLPADVCREVVQRTDGVPLFLEELTKAVLDAGLLAGGPDGEQSGPVAGPVIPSSLRDSLTARLDALGAAKETAQLGAVLGSGFRSEMLEAVSALDRATVEHHVVRLIRSGLVYRAGEPPREKLYFKHALIQDTAYETLLKSRRRQLHDRVASVLLDRFPTIVEDEPETFARHCEEAGRFDEAVDALLRAGSRAMARWAYVEASRSLHKALALLDQLAEGAERDRRELDVLEALQAPVFATRGYTAPELPGIYSRIRALARTEGARVDEFSLLYRSWAFHCVHGDRRETLETAADLLQIWSRSEPVSSAIAAFALGATEFYAGNHPRALEFLTPIVEDYRGGVAHPSASGPLFLAWLVRGWALALAGYPAQAQSTLQDAVAAAERAGDPFALTQALSHLVVVEHDLGCDPAGIRERASRTLAVSEERRLPQTLYSAQVHAGCAAAIMGDHRGIAEARGGIDGMRAMGTLNPVGTLIMVLADALMRIGRSDEALAAVEEALDECATNLTRHHEPDAHLLKGTLLWRSGDRTAAEACLRTALGVAQEQSAKLFELRAATALAGLMAEDGRADEGRARLAGVYTWFREGLDGRHLQAARLLLDELSLAPSSKARP